MIAQLVDLFGRFHPLIVHLPVGILLLSAILALLERKNQSAGFRQAVIISLWFGTVSAVLACITGYVLLQSAEYEDDLAWWHQWMGISLALVSAGWLVLYKRHKLDKIRFVFPAVMLLMIAITGHLGGSLTHGSDFLALNTDDTVELIPIKPLSDVQQAVVYNDIIRPVLEQKCYSCHGDKKQKGRLRLDGPEAILRGGKGGAILSENGDESELIRRLLLPITDKKHMPPKDKPQLTTAQESLVRWWVDRGASFTKKVSETDITKDIAPLLAALEHPAVVAETIPDSALPPVAPAENAALKLLQERGVTIVKAAVGSNYLYANFVSVENLSEEDIQLLVPIKQQLLSLKLSDAPVTDSSMRVIGQLTALRRLHLDRSLISDSGLVSIQSLKKLTDLSLVGTNITDEGLKHLQNLPALRNIYLFQTKISRASWSELEKQFPGTRLDSGGYQVPTRITDTTLVKLP